MDFGYSQVLRRRLRVVLYRDPSYDRHVPALDAHPAARTPVCTGRTSDRWPGGTGPFPHKLRSSRVGLLDV